MSALAPGWWMVPLALWLVVLLVLLVRVGYDRESGVLDLDAMRDVLGAFALAALLPVALAVWVRVLP